MPGLWRGADDQAAALWAEAVNVMTGM